MLLKFVEHFKRQDTIPSKVRGTVVDNDDPLRRGRVRCTIPGVFPDDTPTAELPWCFPLKAIGLGGGNDSSSLVVPNINSTLVIEFLFNDIYAPFYTGVWDSDDTHAGIFDEDYPLSYGSTDETGTYWKINRKKLTAEFNHATGSGVKFKADGTIEMISDKGVRFKSADGQTEVFLDMETGTLDLTSKNVTTLGGRELDINANKVVYDAGSVSGQIKGYQDLNVLGGNKLNVSGSNSLAVAGDEAHSVVGSQKNLVGTNREAFIGLGDSVEVVIGNILHQIRAGNYNVSVNAGNVSIQTMLGSLSFGNLIGDISISPAGAISAEGFSFDASDLVGNTVSISALKSELTNRVKTTVQSDIEAELVGMVKTTVGSSSTPMTSVNGMNVQIKGMNVQLGMGGGLPVARMIDQCFGIGFAGTPVVSTIILGSFTTMSS